MEKRICFTAKVPPSLESIWQGILHDMQVLCLNNQDENISIIDEKYEYQAAIKVNINIFVVNYNEALPEKSIIGAKFDVTLMATGQILLTKWQQMPNESQEIYANIFGMFTMEIYPFIMDYIEGMNDFYAGQESNSSTEAKRIEIKGFYAGTFYQRMIKREEEENKKALEKKERKRVYARQYREKMRQIKTIEQETKKIYQEQSNLLLSGFVSYN